LQFRKIVQVDVALFRCIRGRTGNNGDKRQGNTKEGANKEAWHGQKTTIPRPLRKHGNPDFFPYRSFSRTSGLTR
jgi:hypothetical protein